VSTEDAGEKRNQKGTFCAAVNTQCLQLLGGRGGGSYHLSRERLDSGASLPSAAIEIKSMGAL